jgi:hypothetical protein
VDDRQVLRALTDEGRRDYESVAAAPFFQGLVRDGLVVATEQLPAGSHPLHERWAAVLRHERIPVISYPYEWSFEMLRDAALLQIEVSRRAVEGGFSTKDATSFNVAFRGAQPVFIDVGSFEAGRPSEPWPGYGQFCQLFLNPLVVQAAGGLDFHAWLRGSLNGISSTDAARVLPIRHRLRKGLLVHLTLQARAERRYAEAGSEEGVKGELRQAGFGPKIVLAQLANLERTVRSLTWGEQESAWSGYTERSHYTGDDLPAKEGFVAETVQALTPGLVLDLGANDGRFSFLSLEHGAASVVAVDMDHLVVDRLYRRLREVGEQRVLPLVLDLVNPSPGTGWRSRERRSFVDRVRPDLVLCLAVVHHLALTYTVPFEEIVAFLAEFDAPVVVELPHRDDPMVAGLLARKRRGLFDHYDRGPWEQALLQRFSVDRSEALRTRTLYRCTPLPTPRPRPVG